jgi:glycerophosphoryl diester phosphodiesterase
MKRIALIAAICSLATVGVAAQTCPFEVQAHRGARPAVENTAESIRLAAVGRYNSAEIDVQPLRDGNWVLHHDLFTGRVFVGTVLMPHSITSEDWRHGRLMRPDRSFAKEPPAFFEDAIAMSNDVGIKLAIEVKYLVNCEWIDDLLVRSRALRIEPSWHSPFGGTTRCLAKRGVSDLGFVIGPDPDRKAATAGTRMPFAQRAIQRGMEELEKRSPGIGQDATNRQLLSAEGFGRVAELMDGARRKRVILPSSDIERIPDIVRWASTHRLDLVLYGEDGDDADIRRALRVTGIRPAAVVIDGPAAAFCR